MVTAQEFAHNWHRMVFEQDMTEAWRLMTEDFRRVIVQVTLAPSKRTSERLNRIVEDLSEPSPTRTDIREFFTAAGTILRNACTVPPGAVGAGATTRVEAPTYEVVRLYVLEDLVVDDEGNHYLPHGESARALTLIVAAENDGSWHLAGIGSVMTPGWPPTLAWEPPPWV